MEQLIMTAETKAGKYAELLPQLEALVEAEDDMIANMANVAAALHESFGFWWTGFYRVMNCPKKNSPEETEEILVLGPFQGPLACTRIRKGRGVCGTAWATGETQVVPDVEQFPGHIACSSESKSEIVVPLWKDGKVAGVMDIDSERLATFDRTDREWLEKIAELLMK